MDNISKPSIWILCGKSIVILTLLGSLCLPIYADCFYQADGEGKQCAQIFLVSDAFLCLVLFPAIIALGFSLLPYAGRFSIPAKVIIHLVCLMATVYSYYFGAMMSQDTVPLYGIYFLLAFYPSHLLLEITRFLARVPPYHKKLNSPIS